MVYYLIGAPHKSNEQTAWLEMEKHVLTSGISRQAKGRILQTEIGKFKLGNLDHLMFINDSLLKQESVVESLLKKIERQYLDVTEKVSYDFIIELKEGPQSIENFLFQFRWNDQTFPRASALTELVKAISSRATHVETDLRQKSTSYQELKNQSQQVARKEGNLLVRDLVDVLKEPIVKPRDFIYSDYLTTLVAIVPKTQIQEWLACYEFLCENVVPQSARQFQIEDKDNLTIWRVVIVKQSFDKDHDIDVADKGDDDKGKKQKQTPVEEFIQKARDKLRITVKEFEYKSQESKEREKLRLDLKSKSDHMNTTLKQACEKAFSDLYITYMHLKVLRLVVDIAMRFGAAEPNIQCILKPDQGKEKKVQQSLLKLFADPSQVGLYGTKEELEDTEDFFPFVYVPINIP
ncbi:unnamed protein product [Paramecium octaurelia]|uniref:V-type proton ATPase subunit C n=1 Tax=Paramecium octaurelia TaxID=43137 RepID=A0A8S1UZB0_PAROT|nr:unnamed protein product [Paramecium octaurelia]